MEAISLNYSTWSLGGILGGMIIFILSRTMPWFFDEKAILILISSLGFFSFLFVLRIKEERVEGRGGRRKGRKANKQKREGIREREGRKILVCFLVSVFFF